MIKDNSSFTAKVEDNFFILNLKMFVKMISPDTTGLIAMISVLNDVLTAIIIVL